MCAHTHTHLGYLAEGYPSRPLVHYVHEPKVKVELDILLGVDGQAMVMLQPPEAASDYHHLSCRKQKNTVQYSASISNRLLCAVLKNISNQLNHGTRRMCSSSTVGVIR